MIDYKNIFRIANKILKIYWGYNIPLKVTQYVTYKCNLNCGFCGRTSIKSEELTTAQIMRCIKEFKNLGTEFWGFNGGEPLLREDLGVLINLCRKLDIRTSVSTNGTLLPERINDIKEIDLVLLSIDGPEKIHDEIRGKNTFKKTLMGLEMLKRKSKRVLIVTVLNKENIPYLNDIIKISEYYNCFCEFQPIFMHRSDKEKKANRFIPDQMKDAAEYLLKEKKIGRPIANSYPYLNIIKKYPYSKKLICWAKSFFCVITPDGFVNPCCITLSDENLYKSGLRIGWKNAYSELPHNKVCEGCFIFCYCEYNLILNHPFSSSLRLVENFLKKTWISR